jgi:hypothetical protein
MSRCKVLRTGAAGETFAALQFAVCRSVVAVDSPDTIPSSLPSFSPSKHFHNPHPLACTDYRSLSVPPCGCHTITTTTPPQIASPFVSDDPFEASQPWSLRIAPAGTSSLRLGFPLLDRQIIQYIPHTTTLFLWPLEYSWSHILFDPLDFRRLALKLFDPDQQVPSKTHPE